MINFQVFKKESEQLAPLQDFSKESNKKINTLLERTTIRPSTIHPTTIPTTRSTTVSSTRPPTTKRPVIPPPVHLTR